ncbi:MAG: AAA family ATPase [Deltaproteobacteria bacterium]|nr:AAA family ATPase [Deltaproteobacteria bacterium]
MIRSYFGLDQNPFSNTNVELLPSQQEVFDTIKVHSQQGGLCLIVGEPGTGKTILKEAVCNQDKKRVITPVVNRTLHTYFSIVRIPCEAFQIDTDGKNHSCEKRLIQEAHRINNSGKMLVPIIDDAHLMDIESLRRLRLLCEDFPKNHNLILIAQPELLTRLSLTPNEDIKSRVTYSVLLRKLAPDDLEKFVLKQLEKVGLPHNSFTENALALIVRSSDGVLRRAMSLFRIMDPGVFRIMDPPVEARFLFS